MNDITISKSDIFFLKFNSPGKSYPLSLSSSEDGFLAIVRVDSLIMGTIGFQPLSEDKKYVLTQEVVEIDFKYPQSILKINDFKFDQPIKEKKIPDDKIYELAFQENFTTNVNNESSSKKFYRIDWSPLDTLVNKSYLGVMTSDERVFILGQNKLSNIWEKEFDLLDLYHQYYKDNLLTSTCDAAGFVDCKDVNEYIKLKNDLKLISFSWSSLVRQSKQNQYCLIALLSESGIITIWRIINDQVISRCEIVYRFHLDDNLIKPKIIQFCDISKDMFLLSVFYSDEQVKAYRFSIDCSISDNDITLESVGEPLLIVRQSKYIQPNKYYWSVKYLTLIVGYESELLFAKLDNSNENQISFSTFWLELPSTEEISGIVVKQNVLYVTSSDGYLYGIKLDNNLENIDLNEIFFDVPELKSNCEFLDVFMSPNGVHLGLLKIAADKFAKPDLSKGISDIVLVRMMPEKELFNILMDDNKPFSRKQDAVEELRHTYFSNKHLLHCALQKLVKAESHWDSSTLHNLQLARYLCIFFGYQLNVNHELPDTGNRHLDFSKIRKLESIIISRNISYWLDGFSDLNTHEIHKEDCIFVISLCAKLQMGETNSEIAEAIEAAANKAKLLLNSEFGVDEKEIIRCEFDARRLTCPVCDENCDFNLFASKCPKSHIIPRCCKSLELCVDNFKKCRICGSVEKFVDGASLSNWRLEIINSNCPLCDGKYTKLKF